MTTLYKPDKPLIQRYVFSIAWAFLMLILLTDYYQTGFYDIIAVWILASIPWGVTKLIANFNYKRRLRIFEDEYIQNNDYINQSKIMDSFLNSHQTDVENAVNHKENHPDILEATRIINELQQLITTCEFSQILTELIDVSVATLQKLRDEPQHISSSRKFFSYYLPTSLTLVKKYNNLKSQPIQSENIINSLDKILTSIQLINQALQKNLDALFNHTLIDLEVELSVIETMINKDGLV